MMLLTTLKWDVSVVVATDFMEHLLFRVHLICDSLTPAPASSEGFSEITSLIKQFATDICFICCCGKSINPIRSRDLLTRCLAMLSDRQSTLHEEQASSKRVERRRVELCCGVAN